ncbi:MAG: hypothetical protein MUC65_06225 [Pontiellaceae bacterium]|jgi:general secretion pathway protein D|nr:hypothetical protein [Pontiellaceae bacterium]
MRNAFKFLVAGALIAGTASAQEQSESVDSILRELSKQTAGKQSVPAESPASITEEGEIPAAVIDALDAPATLDASRELYVNGEFEQAQRGFEAVVKKDPENIVARTYLRKLLERDPRIAEVQGMKNVRNAWKVGMVLRSYDVSETAVEKMGLQGITASIDITGKFPEVDFPKGASAVYQPKTGKLFIRNTPENLQVAEEIMLAMDVAKVSSDVEQVEIESKFVEVSEGTLEALGFDWRATSKVPLADGTSISNNSSLFGSALRGGASSGYPFETSSKLDLANLSEWTAFRFEETFSTKPISMTVNRSGERAFRTLITALDQSSGTDVLSAPRIVTRSGEKAFIRVGQLHYYPEVYEVGANEGNAPFITYQDFSEKVLGVELEVTPQVDGEQITMKLTPKVTELAGWQKYSVVNATNSFAYYQESSPKTFRHDPIEARLPIFQIRKIDTEVTINDGSTIGMGGLINEKVEKYEDKVPVFGSLPLIGRLFRNEGERAVKRNLLMFVTARKVDATGRINTSRTFE